MKKITTRCDIFCNVIDNYGDIGVCWRLARQLANEHGLAVRLWVDDLSSLVKLCPEADATLASQHCRGVEVRRWYEPGSPFALKYRRVNGETSGMLREAQVGPLRPSIPQEAQDRPLRQAQDRLRYLSPNGDEEVIQPADVVIEAFACVLPESYIAAMAAQAQQPAWINLEYLSAEDWVEGCHKLPSPHPSLPLVKYFFFPGFTRQTGGLLLERDLLARRDAFQNNGYGKDAAIDDKNRHASFPHPRPLPQAGEGDKDSLREFHVNAAQQAFWRSIGMEMPAAETLKISLFGYENAALHGLFDAWSAGAQPVLCLVPEGRILPQAGQYFGDAAPCAGKAYSRGNLQVRVLPFVEQERYDELLWACDVNYVRGEDSCVRALWAGRPFVWQIYPQHDAVHLKKLEAFLSLYSRQLSRSASQAVEGSWQAWNMESGAGPAWPAFVAVRGELELHAQHWARQMAENNLALNLLDFCREIGRMCALKIEGQ